MNGHFVLERQKKNLINTFIYAKLLYFGTCLQRFINVSQKEALPSKFCKHCEKWRLFFILLSFLYFMNYGWLSGDISAVGLWLHLSYLQEICQTVLWPSQVSPQLSHNKWPVTLFPRHSSFNYCEATSWESSYHQQTTINDVFYSTTGLGENFLDDLLC